MTEKLLTHCYDYRPEVAPPASRREDYLRLMATPSRLLEGPVDTVFTKKDPQRFVQDVLHPKGYRTLAEFLDDEIPLGTASGIIRSRVEQFLERISIYTLPGKPFCQIRGSRSLGVAADRYYMSIGDALARDHSESYKRDSQFEAILRSILKRRGFVVDLDLVTTSLTADELLELWKSEIGSTSQLEEVDHMGQPELQGWRAFRNEADDRTPLFTIEVGNFIKSQFGNKDMLRLTELLYKIEFSHQPSEDADSNSINNTRGGRLVSLPDRFRQGMHNINGQIHIRPELLPPDFNLIFRYGIGMLDLGISPELFAYPDKAVTAVVRALREEARLPSTWDVSAELAELCESTFSPKTWSYISASQWRSEDLWNIVGAAHLSPFVTAVNLVPDSMLPRLSEEVRYKIVRHAIDHSLSLGKLWPHIGEMDIAQIEAFLSGLPAQDEYRPEQDGLNLLMDGLKQSLNITTVYDSPLLDAVDLFSHPEDIAVAELRRLAKLFYPDEFSIGDSSAL